VSLSGHLDLLCAPDSRGLPCLRRQSFRAPIHLSKPHFDEPSRTLAVNVVNPTAGLLAGDRIDCRVEVADGARLLLTTPSASRAHRMREGWAEMTQECSVAAGGFLESWPELFIPQAQTRYRQRNTVRVAEGGELLFFEALAPGRVASGEAFEYEALEWESDLFIGVELAARERYRLARGGREIEALRAVFPAAYYASCFVVSPRLDDDAECWRRTHGLHREDAWVGCSALARGGWVMKIVAAGSVSVRRTLAAVRSELYAALGRPAPDLRRAAPIG
jgi:urease accessory protein